MLDERALQLRFGLVAAGGAIARDLALFQIVHVEIVSLPARAQRTPPSPAFSCQQPVQFG
jgi:hypothetical protein